MDVGPISSLGLEILLYFDYWYSFAYIVLSMGLYVLKGLSLAYPPNALAPELGGLVLLAVLQWVRLGIGSVGNKRESAKTTFWSIVLMLPAGFMGVYYLYLQTYVYYADLVVSGILLIFLLGEFIFSLQVLFKFKKAAAN